MLCGRTLRFCRIDVRDRRTLLLMNISASTILRRQSDRRGRRALKLGLFAGAAFLVGCDRSQILSTTQMPSRSDTPVRGMPYFLPTAYIPITFEGSTVSAPAAGGDKAGTGPSASSGASADTTVMQSPVFKIGVTVGTPVFVADTSRPLFLRYDHSSWADDQFSISVNQNGLLQTSSAFATDKTGAVIEDVAQIGIEVAKLATQVLSAQLTPLSTNGQCSLQPFRFTVDYYPERDPNPAPISRQPALDFKISSSASITIGGSQSGSAPPYGPEAGDQGVLFKIPAPLDINIETKVSDTACMLPAKDHIKRSVTVPGKAEFWEDTSRAPFVAKKVKLTIANGMLTGVDVTNPSEVEGAVKIPLDILKSIASVATLNVTTQPAATGAGMSGATTGSPAMAAAPPTPIP